MGDYGASIFRVFIVSIDDESDEARQKVATYTLVCGGFGGYEENGPYAACCYFGRLR
jgi:hypothetical protein